MSSFTILIKDEITQKDFEPCCQIALLAAVLKLSGVISKDNENIKIHSFHNKTIKLVFKLLKERYENIALELIIEKNKKNPFYTLVINNLIAQIISDLELTNDNLFISKKGLKNHCLRAYVAGVFLVSGSINSPQTSNYHLEMQFSNEDFAKVLQKFLAKKFNFNFKNIIRRNKFVIYLKKSNDISDFLKLLDCPEAVFIFEDKRITRELLNNINRFNNIDIYNQQKSITAGSEQVAMINKIKDTGFFITLSARCQILANLRLEYQEASLQELAELFSQATKEKITKSGVNHLIREFKKKYYEISHI